MIKEQILYRLVIGLFLILLSYLLLHPEQLAFAAPIKMITIAPPPPAPSVTLATQAKTSSKQSFIQSLLPSIRQANQAIRVQRQRLLANYQRFQQQQTISTKEQQWLQQLAHSYRLTTNTFNNEQQWQALLDRVNIVPASLALAQAINESAWGKSRFARLANNYFGQWCYREGCGIVPKQRGNGHTHEVKRFESILASIKDYMLNLNTHKAYLKFRQLRRRLNDGLTLAAGIANYNPSRDDYVKKIKTIIQQQHLLSYDR